MLIVFDMDGVFIEERSSWKIIHKAFGIDNSDIVELYKKGLINDKEFLDRDIERWRNNGIKRKDIEKILYSVPITNGAEECIKFLKRIGKIAIISGGIDILAKRIAKFGIDYIYANGIEFKNEIPWKGILRVPLKEKNKILENLMEKLGKEREEVVVIGDTKYDLCMFKIAGISIAFNPTEEIANKTDYVIKKRDLNELIHIFENY